MLQDNELLRYLEQLTLPGIDYPRASNRGVIDPSASTVFSHLDYIQMTCEAPRNFGRNHLSLPWLNDLFTLTRERHGVKNYRYGADMSPAGTYFWNLQNDVQPGLIVLTGSDLGLIRSRAKISDDELIKTLKKAARRFTRIDYAININAGNPEQVLKHFKKGKVKTRAQSCKRIDLHGKKQGYTVYIGSDKSDKFIRCYDKAAELKLAATILTRIEMQVNNEPAHRLARAMAYHGVKVAGKTAVRDFAQFPKLAWWKDATEGEHIDLQLTPAKETSFARWLLEQVLPAIEKRVLSGQEQDAITDFANRLGGVLKDGYRIGAQSHGKPTDEQEQ